MSKTIYNKVESNIDLPEMEKKIIEQWKNEEIFDKIRKKNKGKEKYIFLEGPPTANGKPHVGHAFTRVVKDVVLRYKAMDSHDIQPWIGGWDCHGLPVELEVEKMLGIESKKGIVEYGLKNFNKLCRKSVFKYRKEWLKMSERIGFWIDFDNAYITMEDHYIESVWSALKKIWERGLLEKDYKVVPYCPRCETPLSSHEVAQGYKNTKDPSIYIKFKIKNSDEYFLVWTTTPWTLISNLLLAVGKDIDYVLIEKEGEKYYLAEALLNHVIKENYKILKKMKGKDLIGLEYEQLIPYVDVDFKAFYVANADFVSTEEGTGIVHIAPAFGVDDYELCKREGVKVVNPVDERGKFVTTPWEGKFVKDADRDIMIWLETNGILFSHSKIEHTYPFCWRCDSPLLYYALENWYILMSKVKEDLVNNNKKINWKPEYLKYGRFGNFLDDVKDWALSRNRYWGTPLPIWRCENGHEIVIGSKEELFSMIKDKPKDFELHMPWVDEVEIICKECNEHMKREPYVIDVWFDSGSAPFAQYHYPFENESLFKNEFPVDFITEGLDQTRGWFYTLLAISTLLFNKPAYKNVLTLGLILDENGEKMSKSKGNVVDPIDVMNKVGADAVRMYLFSIPLWKSRRFSESLIDESKRKTINTLWNVYLFFVNNANLDKVSPETLKSYPITCEMDRWLISRINTTVDEVKKGLDNYEIQKSANAITDFIEYLSNWYLRRSRRRFWKEQMDEEKKSAYAALYSSLITLTKTMAPFTPFLSEEIYRNLSENNESIHLENYPLYNENEVDKNLENRMNIAIKIVEAGRHSRQLANIKVRQPLSEMMVVCSSEMFETIKSFEEIIKEELNIKEITRKEKSGMTKAKLGFNYKKLGPKLKGDLKKVVAEIENMNVSDILKNLQDEGHIIVNGYKIDNTDIEITEEAEEGLIASEIEELGIMVYLNTNITDDLIYEGLAREVIRRIQTMRKDMDLEYAQEISVGYECDEKIKKAVDLHMDYIKRETQSKEIQYETLDSDYTKEWNIDGKNLKIFIKSL